MRKFIVLFLAFTLMPFDFSKAFAADCLGIPDLQTIDKENEQNLRALAKVASVQRRYSEYDYPVLPENFADIIGGTMENLCNQIRNGDNTGLLYKDVLRSIQRNYKDGDPADFFYKYVLTLKCWIGELNFYDSLTKNSDSISILYSNIMRSMYGGVNPNAFIRIRRDGKLFEGPLHVVYDHLEKYYQSSDHYRSEYRSIKRRLNTPRYLAQEKKSLAQIRREDPKMPITLPMP